MTKKVKLINYPENPIPTKGWSFGWSFVYTPDGPEGWEIYRRLGYKVENYTYFKIDGLLLETKPDAVFNYEINNLFKTLYNDYLYLVRKEAYNKIETICIGDHIIFADGKEAFVSHIYGNTKAKFEVQTSSSGSLHMFRNGRCSFSGGLYDCIPGNSLTLTNEKRNHQIWFFDQEQSGAHRGKYFPFDFKVWKCCLNRNHYCDLT